MKSSADADARDALFGIPNNNERIDRMAKELSTYREWAEVEIPEELNGV